MQGGLALQPRGMISSSLPGPHVLMNTVLGTPSSSFSVFLGKSHCSQCVCWVTRIRLMMLLEHHHLSSHLLVSERFLKPCKDGGPSSHWCKSTALLQALISVSQEQPSCSYMFPVWPDPMASPHGVAPYTLGAAAGSRVLGTLLGTIGDELVSSQHDFG